MSKEEVQHGFPLLLRVMHVSPKPSQAGNSILAESVEAQTPTLASEPLSLSRGDAWLAAPILSILCEVSDQQWHSTPILRVISHFEGDLWETAVERWHYTPIFESNRWKLAEEGWHSTPILRVIDV